MSFIGLALTVANGSEDLDSKRDSKNMSAHLPSDRTSDRRSKGVINLLFKSKVIYFLKHVTHSKLYMIHFEGGLINRS